MLSSKTRYPIRRKHLWKGACFGLGTIYLISFTMFGYLKFIGEVLPFCFYDNFFYGTFYFGLFLYSFLMMELSDVPMTKSQARLWYSNKFFGCCIMFIEVEALLQFVLTYRRLSYELEVDFVARRYIYGLMALGIVRLVLVTGLALVGTTKLNRAIEAKSYHSDIFGSAITFFSDFTIIQLYCYTAYIYDYTLPLVLLISVVSYVYYKYIRL